MQSVGNHTLFSFHEENSTGSYANLEYSLDNWTSSINPDIVQNLHPVQTNRSSDYIFDRTDVRVCFLLVYTIVFCCCVFGNLMVVLVVNLHWRMRSHTNFCLANLAFADLCVGIFCVYQNIVTYLIDSWVFGEFMCKMYFFINSLSTTASVLILVVICMERYLAIIHPLACRRILTLNRLRVTIVLVWILSALICSPRFYYFGTIHMPLPANQTEILCLPDQTKYNSKVTDMINLTVLYLIPLTIISILYTHIGIVLWKSSTNRIAQGTPTPSSEADSQTPANSIEVIPLSQLQVCGVVAGTLNNFSNVKQISPSQLSPATLERIDETQGTSFCSRKYFDKLLTENDPLAVPLEAVPCHENVESVDESKASSKEWLESLMRENVQEENLLGNVLTTGLSPQAKNTRRKGITRSNRSGTTVLKSRRRTVKMLICVVVTFALCHLPFHGRKVWQYWSPKWAPFEAGSVFSNLFTPFTFLVMYAHSAVNPALYALMSSTFRICFKDLLCCRIKSSLKMSRRRLYKARDSREN